MIIKDSKGYYDGHFDESKRILFMKVVGTWKSEDAIRYHEHLVAKLTPLFNGKPFALYFDMKNYKMSNISKEWNDTGSWFIANGVKCVVGVVENVIVQMQLNRVGVAKVPSKYFLEEKEAKNWLKGHGF